MNETAERWRECYADFQSAVSLLADQGEKLDSPEKAFILGWQLGVDRDGPGRAHCPGCEGGYTGAGPCRGIGS